MNKVSIIIDSLFSYLFYNDKKYIIPSEEEKIKMYAFDFEEFLWAMENDILMDFIRECYEKQWSILRNI